MKKFLAGLFVLFVFVVSLPILADAQTCRCRSNYSSRRYSNRRTTRYATNRYNNNGNRSSYSVLGESYQRPTFYQRHRNLINLGIGSGGGAIIGALTGGKRGALLGTAIGAGSGALYTYVLNPKKRRYYRR